MSDKDGGPAFPAPGVTGYEKDGVVTFVNWPGMTMRDYFAAKAMQGTMAMDGEPHKRGQETWQQAVARCSYEVADAMLAERSK